MANKEELNRLTERIIGAALEVHRALGPGLLESAYLACLAFELLARGLRVEIQKPLPLMYKGVTMDCSYRMDIVVEGLVVVEVKSVESLNPVHEAQMISYLRLSGCCLGLLMNFNVKWFADKGIKRLVHNFPDTDMDDPRSPRAPRLNSSTT